MQPTVDRIHPVSAAPGRVAVFGPQTPGSSTNYTFTFIDSNGTQGDLVDLVFAEGIFPGILGDGEGRLTSQWH
jgi:hypothetical protein